MKSIKIYKIFIQILLFLSFLFKFNLVFGYQIFTEKLQNVLESSVEELNDKINLPKDSIIGKDKQDAEENIDELLDDILEILEISEASKIKEQYRTVENLIQEERDEISSLKEKRMFAKKKKDDSFSNLVPDASKLLPDSSLKESIQSLTATTKSDYDQIIKNKNENIVAYQEELALLRENLSNELEKKDINISPEQLEVWLSSVVGDDIISMNVIFQNVKQVTQQLQELTQETNENLEFARKYYGMVVILNRIIVKMQEKFIFKVESKIIPQLKEYESDALSNIKDAKKLLVKNKNNQTLKGNVKANEFTVKVIKFYRKVVINQKNKIKKSLLKSKESVDISLNTYKTVKLSSMVSELIKDGLENFETVEKLQLPVITKFENKQMQEEFKKLSMRFNLST